jgi:GTPase SAR1 family protein
MVVYDTSNRESFNSVQKWLQEIDRYACDNVCKMLIGAKDDLPKAVATEDARSFAEQLNLKFMETSSKTGHNVFDSFATLAITIAEKLELETGEVKEGQEKAAVEKENDSDDESFEEEDLAKGMLEGLQKEEGERKEKKEKKEKREAKKVKASKANVNVFRLDLSALDSDAPVLTGDPVSTPPF